MDSKEKRNLKRKVKILTIVVCTCMFLFISLFTVIITSETIRNFLRNNFNPFVIIAIMMLSIIFSLISLSIKQSCDYDKKQ